MALVVRAWARSVIFLAHPPQSIRLPQGKPETGERCKVKKGTSPVGPPIFRPDQRHQYPQNTNTRHKQRDPLSGFGLVGVSVFLRHRPRDVLVDVTILHLLGERSLAASGQNFGLINPVVTGDAAFEAFKIVIHPGNLCRTP